MAECCPISPLASSQSLPRSSGEDRPLPCRRCWQSCWRPQPTHSRILLPPRLPCPEEPPRPPAQPVSPLPPRPSPTPRSPTPRESDASWIFPISPSRPFPWIPVPQLLNSNLDYFLTLQPPRRLALHSAPPQP